MRVRSLLVGTGLLLAQLVTAPVSDAAIGFTCRFDEQAAVVRIDIVWDDVGVNVRRQHGGDAIVVNGRRCHDATVHDVDRIRVVGSPGLQILTIDLSGGPLGPGRTPERTRVAEIEVSFEGGLGQDMVLIQGGRRRDVIGLGGSGAAIGRDSDTDAWWWGVEYVGAGGGDGADRLRAMSGRGVPLHGDLGADVLVGNVGRDRLSGGGGDDRIAGFDGDDRIFPGRGADRVGAGPGDDRLFLEDRMREDVVACGDGDDVLRTADPEDLDVLTDCETVPS